MNTSPTKKSLLAEKREWEATAARWADLATTDSYCDFQHRLALEKAANLDLNLQRVSRGTYGRCDRCGRPINPERLEAIKDSDCHTCIDCAQAAKLRQRTQRVPRRPRSTRRYLAGAAC